MMIMSGHNFAPMLASELSKLVTQSDHDNRRESEKDVHKISIMYS